jgi:hypothetical protein
MKTLKAGAIVAIVGVGLMFLANIIFAAVFRFYFGLHFSGYGYNVYYVKNFAYYLMITLIIIVNLLLLAVLALSIAILVFISKRRNGKHLKNLTVSLVVFLVVLIVSIVGIVGNQGGALTLLISPTFIAALVTVAVGLARINRERRLGINIYNNQVVNNQSIINGNGYMARIARLKEYKADGIITNEVYYKKVKEILKEEVDKI